MTKTTDPRRRYQLLFATTIHNSGRVNDVQETSNNVGCLEDYSSVSNITSTLSRMYMRQTLLVIE